MTIQTTKTLDAAQEWIDGGGTLHKDTISDIIKLARERLEAKAPTPPPPGQYDDLVKRYTNDGTRPFPLPQVAGRVVQPRYAIYESELAELVSAITDLQQQVRDGRGKAVDESAKECERMEGFFKDQYNEAPPSRKSQWRELEEMCALLKTAILALKDKP